MQPQLSYFYTYERRPAKISDPFSPGGFPVWQRAPGQVSEELGALVLPRESSWLRFSKAAKALSPCSSTVAAATVTERFCKAGFSGSILLPEEGRDSTSASLNEDKREEE